MGVGGAVGFLKKHNWGQPKAFRDTKVVIDVTNGFYWFVKEQLLENYSSSGYSMDKYGTSMTEYSSFLRDFFKRMRERKIYPILVYDGYRKDESKGPIASKTRHMIASSDGALARLRNHQYGQLTSLPELATNCLKEIVKELGFERDQLHQAVHEVYPVLEQLAREHNCPVMTSHSDFIFSNVSEGFIWFDGLTVPTNSESVWYCTLYSHASMMGHFNLPVWRHSEAVRCLSVLLREDFVREYYPAVNRVLQLRGTAMELGARNHGTLTRRLIHVMSNWPYTLRTVASVRSALEDSTTNVSAGHDLLRDFDATWHAYSNYKSFRDSELVAIYAADQISDLHDALVCRESTADFLANLQLTDFRRTNIQDVKTFRSTFSVCDRVKQYLMVRMASGGRDLGRLYDRELEDMRNRTLERLDVSSRGHLFNERLSQAVLFELFHFDEKARERLAERLTRAFAIDSENSNRLALLLLLARFALKVTPRENYDNTDPAAGSSSNTGSLTEKSLSRSNSASGRARSNSIGASSASTTTTKNNKSELVSRYHSVGMQEKYFRAIINSYVYHLGRLHQGDQSSQEVPADIRVARAKITELAEKRIPSVQASPCDQYYTCKHLVEALNSTLHGYKELNSLYNFVGPNILVNKYYDGVLIYKLMTASNNVSSYLLRLDADLQRDLYCLEG